ncbi:putative reverse transcriptase domain-containing protein [Tanacetum coccineum]
MTRLHKARIYVRPHPPPSLSTEALIAEFASAPKPTSPPSSPLSPLSSPLPRTLSPPLHTSPTYAKAPLGYRAAMIQLRAASPSTYHPLHVPSPPLLLPSTAHRTDIPKAEMPPRKRVYFIAPTRRFEVGESSTAAAARQTGHTLARRVDYGFIDTVDASIRASKSRVMTTVEEVNEMVTDLATTQGQDAHELYVRCEDAQDDQALLRAQISLLTRERRYFCSMASSYEREVVYARQAWSRSEDRSTALEASIRTLEAHVRTLQTQHNKMEWQRQNAGDLVTTAFGRIHALEARDQARPNDLKDTDSKLALEYGEGFQKNTDEVGKYVRDPLHDPGKQTENKRKHIYNTRNNHTQQKPHKRQNVARAYTAGPGEKREYGGSLPLCTKCNYHHNGQCAPKCNYCKKVGHLARDCRSPAANANNQRNSRVIQRVVTCFECEV